MKYKAVLEVEREDAKDLGKAIDKVLKIKERAYGELIIKGNKITIKVEAKDANSFRAALNSYLRILQATENIKEV